MENNDLFAVYGSLRSGMGNHRVIQQSTNDTREADGIIANQFFMVNLGGFPGLIKPTRDIQTTNIVVEVYKVTSEGQAQGLDSLEGYPSFYDREQVTLVDGRLVWVYFLHDERSWGGHVSYYSDNEKVVSGDWKEYRGIL